MGRVLAAAAVVVVALSASARAGSNQHVMVETDPKGAVVYVDDVEKGPVCQPTPCSFDIAAGHYTLIVQKQAFAPSIENIDVPRRPKRPLVFNYKLEAASGAIIINNPAAKGAQITVDGAAKGKVDASGSARIDVEPGGHQVTVTLGKKTLFEDIVNADVGQETTITVTAGPGKETASTDDGGGDTTEPPHTDEPEVPPAPPAPHVRRMISGDVIFDVGFRRFTYQNPKMGPLSTEGEDGNVLAGPEIEVWPMEIFDVPHLRALSLYLRFEFPVNHQDVVDGKQNVIATTQWVSYEASVKYRWTISDAAAFEVGGGYVRDMLRFNGDPGDVDKLPDSDYQSLRIGARASLLLGMFEPYISAENRFILDGGVLPTRFCAGATCASGTGFRGAIGIAARYDHFVGRIEGSDIHYSWTFANSGSSTGNFYMADGTTDKILGVSVMLGYQY
jgi:hypothetical protein